MKRFLKQLRTGLLFFLLNCLAFCAGYISSHGFTLIPNSQGWETVQIAFGTLLMACFSGFVVWSVGYIIETLKTKWEDTKDDNN